MEDSTKEFYILLGEIKKNQEHHTRNQEINTAKIDQMEKRLTAMESKINYAIGVVAAIIFFFQAGWTYLTKMGKA